MTARLAALALLPLCGLAQLRVLVVERGIEREPGDAYDAGSVAVGDTLVLNFRVRNAGTSAAVLQSIRITGAGFALANSPPLPYTIAPGASVDFAARLTAASAGAYSGTLAVNGGSIGLRVTAASSAELLIESALALTALDAGATADFGRVERGSSATRRFHLVNRTGGWLRVAAVRVEGQAFSGPSGLALPALLDAGQRILFDVKFSPQSVGAAEGVLEIDGRRFILKGTGVQIPLPQPVIRLGLEAPASAQQGRLRIELAEPARISGTGEVRIDFRSAVAGVTADPAILFLPVSSRFAPFSVREGDTRVRFGDRDEIAFQTGTTAGSLVFTARLGDYSEQASVAIAAGPVAFDSVKATRSGSQIEVQIVGYDNARSISQLVFGFFDAREAPVAPGALRADVTADFRRYFESSTVGGAFALRAVFPVSGNPSEIVSVEVAAANSSGATPAVRLRLP